MPWPRELLNPAEQPSPGDHTEWRRNYAQYSGDWLGLLTYHARTLSQHEQQYHRRSRRRARYGRRECYTAGNLGRVPRRPRLVRHGHYETPSLRSQWYGTF